MCWPWLSKWQLATHSWTISETFLRCHPLHFQWNSSLCFCKVPSKLPISVQFGLSSVQFVQASQEAVVPRLVIELLTANEIPKFSNWTTALSFPSQDPVFEEKVFACLHLSVFPSLSRFPSSLLHFYMAVPIFTLAGSLCSIGKFQYTFSLTL